MPYAVFAVIPDMERCRAVLEAWEGLGVFSVTILESIGLQKIRETYGQLDDLPLMPSFRHLVQSEEYHHRTMFVILDDNFDLDQLIAATDAAVGGSLDDPNTGILFVVPVVRVRGLKPSGRMRASVKPRAR